MDLKRSTSKYMGQKWIPLGEEIDNSNKPIVIKEIEAARNYLPNTKQLDPNCFSLVETKQLKNNINSLKSSPENRSRGNTW